MPYKDLPGSLTREQTQNGWQVRMAIAPFAVTENDPNNKIEIIKSNLTNISKQYAVNPKLWLIPNEYALYNGEYDGTTSKQGKDREQRGKEVCIYLPDTSYASSEDMYKKMLLTLWYELQKADVPLLYIDPPGERKIMGPFGLPTPFSITSFSQRQEWKDKHGILFKQFVPYDNDHPILKIQFSQKDLDAQNTQFNAIEVARLNREYFKDHQTCAIERLQLDIDAILQSPISYREALWNKGLIDHIKQTIKSYNTEIQTIEIDDRGPFQNQFAEQIKQDESFQFILNGYPHDSDSNFSEHPNIRLLKNLTQLKEDEVDGLVQQLRDDYDQKSSIIKPDFDQHTNGNNESLQSMRIDWARYIPGYGDKICSQLIEKNPAQMQAVYRRVILLEREKLAYEGFKNQWLKAHYQSEEVYTKLASFDEQIRLMQNAVNSEVVDVGVLGSFQALHTKIESEIFSHKKCDINKTPYLAIIDNFTLLAKELNLGKKPTAQEMTISLENLDKELLNKSPMTRGLKTALCAVVCAVLGVAIGFTAGAAVTFWCGGLGAIPAAICGGIAGFALGGGGAGAGAAVGFFTSGKQYTDVFKSEIDAVYTSLSLKM